LKEVFKKYLHNHDVDLMSIDVEGYELEVLMGNDWKRFRPKVIIVETLHFNHTQIVKYLDKMGYLLVYNGDVNSIFIDKRKFTKNSGLNPDIARMWFKDEEKVPAPIGKSPKKSK